MKHAQALQQVAILGSTGSIGVSTLEVLALHPDRFAVFGLSAATQVEALLAQCVRLQPRWAVMASEPHGRLLAQKCLALGLPTQVRWGAQALVELAAHTQVDVVMAAIVGAAGLAPCLAAARSGKRLLLANKEALVVGGAYFLQAVEQGGAQLLPVDSEHSAIFQSLPADASAWAAQIDKIFLTASGGPFRSWDSRALRDVTPDQACAHPTWVMGRKISVDSATMMNKALEVIEACFLFGLAPAQIEVLIHPQSVVHGMVQYRDGSLLAQLGTPDMKTPIAYALAWPDRLPSGARPLDFKTMTNLSFEPWAASAHTERFPGLALAWQVLAAPAGTSAVLNAANEVAVMAFLERRIRFDQIHAVNLATLAAVVPGPVQSLEDLLALDAESRTTAEQAVKQMAI